MRRRQNRTLASWTLHALYCSVHGCDVALFVTCDVAEITQGALAPTLESVPASWAVITATGRIAIWTLPGRAWVAGGPVVRHNSRVPAILAYAKPIPPGLTRLARCLVGVWAVARVAWDALDAARKTCVGISPLRFACFAVRSRVFL